MHSLLFAIGNQDTAIEGVRDKWWSTVRALEQTATRNKGVVRLAFGCWQIPVNDGLPFFGHAVAESEKQGLPYSVLFLESDPQMVERHHHPASEH